jgi:hypothetical protein
MGWLPSALSAGSKQAQWATIVPKGTDGVGCMHVAQLVHEEIGSMPGTATIYVHHV